MQGLEHRLLEAGVGARGDRPRLRDLGSRRQGVGKGPTERGADAVAQIAQVGEPGELGRLRQHGRAEGYGGIEVGGGHPDPGDVARQMALGLAYIGPALEQALDVADGQHRGQFGRRRAGVGGLGNLLRRTACEDGELEQGRATLAFVAGQGGLGLIDQFPRPGQVEIRGDAVFGLDHGEVVGLADDGERLLGDRDLLGIGAGVEISAGGFAYDADPGDTLGRALGVDVGPGGLHRAPDPSEEVDFIGDVEARRIEAVGGGGPASRGDRIRRGCGGHAVGRAGRQGRRRETARLCERQGAARLGKIGRGDEEGLVVGQCFLHEPVEGRDIVEFPPVRRRLVGRSDGGG